MIDQKTALRIIRPLSTMPAQFGQTWEPQEYARIITTYGREAETALRVVAELSEAGTDRPSLADLKASLLASARVPQKPIGKPNCRFCGSTGYEPLILVIRHQEGPGGQWSWVEQSRIGIDESISVTGRDDPELAHMQHFRQIQADADDNESVLEGVTVCRCRKQEPAHA